MTGWGWRPFLMALHVHSVCLQAMHFQALCESRICFELLVLAGTLKCCQRSEFL